MILVVFVQQHVVIETDDNVTIVQVKSFANQMRRSFFAANLYKPTIVQSLLENITS